MSKLPQFNCHKRVGAAKITAIHGSDTVNMVTLIFGDINGSREVPAEFLQKHNPVLGGYFVEYEDEYVSFSPAKAFEQGYKPAVDSAAIQAEVNKATGVRPGNRDGEQEH